MTGEGLTRTLARYAVGTRFDALPQIVQHEATRAFVNWIGVTIAGSGEDAPNRAAAMAVQQGSGCAMIIGHGHRVDAATAAFVNCIASSVLAFDDAHLPTVAHPSGPAAAALFALAQTRKVSGPHFLNALALGIELQCRVANMLVQPPSPINPAFYVNGFSGPIGVAAAVGRLLDLDEQRMIWAIGLGATQASGFRSTHGTMTAHFRSGLAARSGVLSALLAEQGFDCTDDSLESVGGFVDVYAPGSDPAIATDGLGIRHEMLDNRYKPYPCGIVIHPVIGACQDIHSQIGPDSGAIAAVRLLVNPLVLKLTGKRVPRTALESHISVYHWTAHALLSEAPGLGATDPAGFNEPALAALRGLIEAEAVPSMDKGEARVEVTLADGRSLSAHVTQPRGSKHRPMTDAELDAKFLDLAARKMPQAEATRLLKACWQVADANDVGTQIASLLP